MGMQLRMPGANRGSQDSSAPQPGVLAAIEPLWLLQAEVLPAAEVVSGYSSFYLPRSEYFQ